ncbi:aminotransferase [Candidatus Falkowbacteria bacterium CG10_big_fil_rev_8_21_14_0_10_44_15]|uniref:Aminotransferase n=1 Tax=Candidatus Falkowbacteria bacterium CG10_big_fil_rev_8_21_14_0_10_44_15 TaxID=1974569 RepID=A0A2H0V088_9BACT|nr:MAG: aminotransferase [Candidatus Falkowbacteria bacterium CG10_big_fil_rev_8_21_14_0_10_44_15]
MAKKIIPWYQPQTGSLERKLISQVLKSDYLNEGEYTTRFEKETAKLIDAKHVIAVTSGTIAIFLSLKALGIGAGDEVIVPDLTFIATANAVDLCGAKPVLVDINPNNLTISVNAIKKAITKKTKAIIPVHVSGRGADMEEIMKLARHYKLKIVEDVAEAFMSKYKGKYLGTFGDAGCFSLSPFKVIMTGQGGLIATNNDKLALYLRQLKDQGRPRQGTGGDDIHPVRGYNFKFTNLQAAIGLGQLAQLESRLEKIRKTYKQYSNKLISKNFSLFEFNIDSGEVPLWVDGWTKNRNKLSDYLHAKNIGCRNFWLPLHRQKPYRLADKNFSYSIKMSSQSLWLPSAFTSSSKDIDLVCREINSFFK